MDETAREKNAFSGSACVGVWIIRPEMARETVEA